MKPPVRPRGGMRKGVPISPEAKASQMISEGKRPGIIMSATGLGRKRVTMLRIKGNWSK